MCVPFIINQTPAAGTVTAPSGLRTPAGLWAIPSTESGPNHHWTPTTCLLLR